MKNSYAAVTVQDRGKYYSYVVKINDGDNALSRLAIKGIMHANIYQTKKKAEDVASFWNDCYKENGTYLFSYPLF